VRIEDCQVENPFTLQPFNSPYPTPRVFDCSSNPGPLLVLLKNNQPVAIRSPKPKKLPNRLQKGAQFLRGLEEEFHASPLFGISTLKRLSRVCQKARPLSRETFKAYGGSIVKRRIVIFLTLPMGFHAMPRSPPEDV
jgi:hypothetical protein